MAELPTGDLISVTEAIRIIDACEVTVRTEEIALGDADGRVLAQEVRADRDYPPFDRSLMDGFAVRAGDLAAGSSTLRNIGESSAGRPAGAAISAGECVAIMTGAPLPIGADAVVPIERVMVDGATVRFTAKVEARDSVSPRGAEAAAGDLLLAAGVRLGPAQIGVCAQVGVSRVRVAVRPQVGVLSSGNEVVGYDTLPSGAEIRNSNSPLLMSLVKRYGCEAVDLGHVPDDAIKISEALQTPGLNAILITGGMSMGAYDYTPGVMRDLGYDLKITKLRIKPGKPFVMGLKTAKSGQSQLGPNFIFGLPGNPVSTFVCTARLASRVLLRLQGISPEPRWVSSVTATPLLRNGPREFYQPAVFTSVDTNSLSLSSSADLFTLARANALIRRCENEDAVSSGSTIQLMMID